METLKSLKDQVQLIEEIRDMIAEKGTSPIHLDFLLTTPERKQAFEQLKEMGILKFPDKPERSSTGVPNPSLERRNSFPIALQGNWREILKNLQKEVSKDTY